MTDCLIEPHGSGKVSLLMDGVVGGAAQWLGRRSLTGGLSLICA